MEVVQPFIDHIPNMVFHLILSHCSQRNFKTMAGNPGGLSRTPRTGRIATKVDTGKQERRAAGMGASTYLGNLWKHEHPVLAAAEVRSSSLHASGNAIQKQWSTAVSNGASSC